MKLIKTVDVENGSITFEWPDATKHTVNINDLSNDIMHRLALHGLSQKLGDTCAGAESIVDALVKWKQTWENLKEGTWRTGGGNGGIMAEAIARVTGKDITDVIKVLAGLEQPEKNRLRQDRRIKAEIARIQLERLGDVADGSEELRSIFDSE
jgi:hypothetical protein